MSDLIKMGDVVRLKSGGPLMTVGKITTVEDVEKGEADDIEGAATCAWFEIMRGCAYVKEEIPWGGAQAGVFHIDMLVKADPPEA